MGIGDWGLGIGDWGLGMGPNPQSPIPNPQYFKKNLNDFIFIKWNNYFLDLFNQVFCYIKRVAISFIFN